MVVGRPSAWPQVWARWPAPKRVKSGMFSDSVDQKPIMPIRDGPEELPEVAAPAELGRLVEQRAEAAGLAAHPDQQHERADEDEGRRPVLEAADRLHAPVDDARPGAPRRARTTATWSRRSRRSSRRRPSRRRSACRRGSRSPRRRSRSGCRTSRRPPAPAPAAGRLAPRRPKEARAKHREGDAVLGSRVAGEQHRHQHDQVGQGDGEHRLLPVHADARPARRPASRTAMLWAMPTHSAEKLYVVQVRFCDGDRQQVLVGVGAAGRRRTRGDLHPAVGEGRLGRSAVWPWERCRSWAGQSIEGRIRKGRAGSRPPPRTVEEGRTGVGGWGGRAVGAARGWGVRR